MSRDAFTDEAHYLRDEIKRLRKSLSELTTSLEVLLKMRGFRIYRKEPYGFRLTIGPIKSFGETLEWFLSKVFKVEFAAEAIWGIRFKRPRVGGDYDLIAKVEGKILYMEIKSSPPNQII